MDLAAGLETGSPYLYLHSAAISLQGDLYCFVLYPSGSQFAEATHALRSFSVHYMNLSYQTVFTCLGV